MGRGRKTEVFRRRKVLETVGFQRAKRVRCPLVTTKKARHQGGLFIFNRVTILYYFMQMSMHPCLSSAVQHLSLHS